MDRWLNRYCRLLELLMAVALALMVVLVLGNVVLRYVFNTGITVSEELSRWLFVWLTFLSATVAMKEHGHLGVDMLVRSLPDAGKKAALVVGQLLMLWVCWLLTSGSWQQVQINLAVSSPTMGLPMGLVYAVGLVFGVSAAVFLLHDLWRTVTGRLRSDELVMVKESEETAELEELQARLAEEDRGQAAQAPGRGRP